MAARPPLGIPSTGEEQDLCKAQGGRAAAVTHGISVRLPEHTPSPTEHPSVDTQQVVSTEG